MNTRTILTILGSIVIGLYIAYHSMLFSGINPILDKVLLTLSLVLLLATLISILKEPDKRVKGIQFAIVILAILIGLYKAKRIHESFSEEPSRLYYQSSKDLSFF